MSEKMRSEFEAWYDSHVRPAMLGRKTLTDKATARAAYLAGRESMKEEAAKVCDGVPQAHVARGEEGWIHRAVSDDFAAAIRGIPNDAD